MLSNPKFFPYAILVLVAAIWVTLLVGCSTEHETATVVVPAETTTTISTEDLEVFYGELQKQEFYEYLSTTTTTTVPVPIQVPAPVVDSPVEVAAPQQVSSGIPDDSYWDRMAQCETAGNWQHFPYGTWTGGLGIYNQTWIGWGGGEFAPTAGQASREEQIIVANRIATLGYGNLGPAGYSAWGCLSAVGYP